MSTPNEQNPWPVYGQEPNSGASEQNPWPVYGQPSGSAPQQNQHLGTGYPGQAPTNPSPQQQPPAGGPFVTPQYGAQGGSGMYRPQGGQAQQMPGQDLPSRTVPILMIVLGALMMIIIAPVVMVSILLSGVGFSQILEQSLQTQNGGTVTVGDSGMIGVVTTSSSSTCTLDNGSGPIQMVPEADGSMLVARGLNPGQYTLHCEGLSAADTIVILDATALDNIFPATMAAFGWASAVGFAGLGILIWGIVWLVKRNRQRKALMSPPNPYGPAGYGPPGGYGY